MTSSPQVWYWRRILNRPDIEINQRFIPFLKNYPHIYYCMIGRANAQVVMDWLEDNFLPSSYDLEPSREKAASCHLYINGDDAALKFKLRFIAEINR